MYTSVPSGNWINWEFHLLPGLKATPLAPSGTARTRAANGGPCFSMGSKILPTCRRVDVSKNVADYLAGEGYGGLIYDPKTEKNHETWPRICGMISDFGTLGYPFVHYNHYKFILGPWSHLLHPVAVARLFCVGRSHSSQYLMEDKGMGKKLILLMVISRPANISWL